MEFLKLVVKLGKSLAWPSAVILILYFVHKNYGDSIASLLMSKVRSKESRHRIATAGIDAKFVENLQEKMMQIAAEPYPERRLEIAREALSVDDKTVELASRELSLLKKLEKEMYPSFLYWSNGDREELAAYHKLHRLRLISSASLASGEEIGTITSMGKRLLQKSRKLPSENITH